MELVSCQWDKELRVRFYCMDKATGRVLKSELRCAVYDYVTDTIPGEVGCGHCGAAEGDQSFIAVIRVTVVGNNLRGMGLFCFR